MIKCEVCGALLEFMTWTHLRTHGLTLREYHTRFPDAPLSTLRDYDLPMEVSDVEFAYFAGILDGEGCFGSYQQGPRITIGMNDEATIDWIVEHFGGNKQREGKSFRWTVYTRACRRIIPLVLPHLITKREAAEKLFEIANNPSFTNWNGRWAGERTEITSPTRGRFR